MGQVDAGVEDRDPDAGSGEPGVVGVRLGRMGGPDPADTGRDPIVQEVDLAVRRQRSGRSGSRRSWAASRAVPLNTKPWSAWL